MMQAREEGKPAEAASCFQLHSGVNIAVILLLLL